MKSLSEYGSEADTFSLATVASFQSCLTHQLRLKAKQQFVYLLCSQSYLQVIVILCMRSLKPKLTGFPLTSSWKGKKWSIFLGKPDTLHPLFSFKTTTFSTGGSCLQYSTSLMCCFDMKPVGFPTLSLGQCTPSGQTREVHFNGNRIFFFPLNIHTSQNHPKGLADHYWPGGCIVDTPALGVNCETMPL